MSIKKRLGRTKLFRIKHNRKNMHKNRYEKNGHGLHNAREVVRDKATMEELRHVSY